jgi:putative PIN family toxin of toxin-antitoxin system
MLRDMKQLRVVLDTNVVAAASRSRRGASFAVLRLLREGRFIALASVPLLLEYEAVLKRPEHLAFGGRTPAMTDAFLDALCRCCEPVNLYYLWRPRARDPSDDMVLETALNGRADRLVTLNTRDFAAAAQFRLAVAQPGELLCQLQKGQS